jgi:hypothetical protein
MPYGVWQSAYTFRMTSTHVAGLMAYGAATVACLFSRARAGGDIVLAKVSALLAVLESALLLDIVFNWRWALHNRLQDIFVAHHLYDRRRVVQVLMLAAIAAALAVAFRLALRRPRPRRHWWTLAAACGGSLSFGIWCVEVISLHEVDRILYTRVAGVLVVAYLWALPCLLTTVSILMAARASALGRLSGTGFTGSSEKMP